MGKLDKKISLKCIDLFAGVGEIRLGFEQAAKDFGFNTQCVFTSEIDDWACKTYRKKFPQDSHDPKSDITKVDETSIPDFDEKSQRFTGNNEPDARRLEKFERNRFFWRKYGSSYNERSA